MTIEQDVLKEECHNIKTFEGRRYNKFSVIFYFLFWFVYFVILMII